MPHTLEGYAELHYPHHLFFKWKREFLFTLDSYVFFQRVHKKKCGCGRPAIISKEIGYELEPGMKLEPRLQERKVIERVMDSYGFLNVLSIERIEKRMRSDETILVFWLTSRKKIYVKVIERVHPFIHALGR